MPLPPHAAPCADEATGDLPALVAELRTLASLTTAVARALSQSLPLPDSLRQCADALVRHLGAAFARIWTLNAKDDILELQASAGRYTHLDGPHSRIPMGRLKIGLIAQQRKPHLTNEVVGDPRIGDQDWARQEGMVAFAGYPLMAEGRVVGVMALFSRGPLTSTTLHALAAVSESIAHGIAHSRAVETLRASEERFALAVQGTAEGIWDWNVLTQEVYFSPRFKELLEFAEEEAEGSYGFWETRLHPEDRDGTLAALRRHLEERHPFQVDYRLLTKSDRYRWFHARGQALWDQAGKPTRMLGSLRDITARKISEARLAAVHRVTQILAESVELAESMPRILRSLCEHFGWAVGEYWVRDREKEVLSLAVSCDSPAGSAPCFTGAGRCLTFRRGAGLPGRAWASARPEWIEDIAKDKEFTRIDAAARDRLRSAVAMPLLIRGEVAGVMQFLDASALKPDDELRHALGDISLQCSRRIELQEELETVRRHRHEMAIAHHIQQHMFPKRMPSVEGCEIAGATEPASETGGDYYDFVPLSSGQILFAVGDVSGHGLGPALVMASARAYVRVLALMDVTIDRIVNLVNARLAEDTDEEFMSLFLGVLNPFNRSLIYYNAGHCPGVILDRAGDTRATLRPSDKPLGIDTVTHYRKSGVVQMLPGDLLLVHSDGVFEARSPGGEPFGMARVLDHVRVARHRPPASIIGFLFDAIRGHVQGIPHDDITATIIKVAEEA